MKMNCDFIDIALVNPKILLDIKYATSDNFLGFAVYHQAICYLHKDTAKALDRVQQYLEQKNLGLKVFDGYRPIPVRNKSCGISFKMIGIAAIQRKIKGGIPEAQQSI